MKVNQLMQYDMEIQQKMYWNPFSILSVFLRFFVTNYYIDGYFLSFDFCTL